MHYENSRTKERKDKIFIQRNKTWKLPKSEEGNGHPEAGSLPLHKTKLQIRGTQRNPH
jgi:hypothetical protein